MDCNHTKSSQIDVGKARCLRTRCIVLNYWVFVVLGRFGYSMSIYTISFNFNIVRNIFIFGTDIYLIFGFLGRIFIGSDHRIYCSFFVIFNFCRINCSLIIIFFLFAVARLIFPAASFVLAGVTRLPLLPRPLLPRPLPRPLLLSLLPRRVIVPLDPPNVMTSYTTTILKPM